MVSTAADSAPNFSVTRPPSQGPNLSRTTVLPVSFDVAACPGSCSWCLVMTASERCGCEQHPLHEEPLTTTLTTNRPGGRESVGSPSRDGPHDEEPQVRDLTTGRELRLFRGQIGQSSW